MAPRGSLFADLKSLQGGVSPTAMDLRLKKDLEELSYQRLSARGTSLTVRMMGSHNLQCTLLPVEGCYAGGRFVFAISIPRKYPYFPPQILSLNKVFHPNFDHMTGRIHMSLLQDEWLPILTINTVLFALQLLFLEPNVQSEKAILNKLAGEMCMKDMAKFSDAVKLTMNGGHFFGENWRRTRLMEGERMGLGCKRQREESVEVKKKKPRLSGGLMSSLANLSLNSTGEDDDLNDRRVSFSKSKLSKRSFGETGMELDEDMDDNKSNRSPSQPKRMKAVNFSHPGSPPPSRRTPPSLVASQRQRQRSSSSPPFTVSTY